MTNNNELYKFPVVGIKPRAAICYTCWARKLALYQSVEARVRLDVLKVTQPSLTDLAALEPLDGPENGGHIDRPITYQEDTSNDQSPR